MSTEHQINKQLLAEGKANALPAGEALPMAKPRTRKRVFVGLICGTSFALCALLALGWGIPLIGFSSLHPALPYITGAVMLLLLGFIGWAALALVLQVAFGKTLHGSGRTRLFTVRILLPLMELCGRVVGISPKEVRGSFIQVNNELVLHGAGAFEPQRILLLLPHCIQWSGCPLRVSNNLARCRRCGRCGVGDLQNLCEKYGVHMAVATGGTIARRIVIEKKPKLILAVACERDLSSGIQDTYPLPVYGILNLRPHGPCVDTGVSLPEVEAALQRFIRPDCLPA